jgi:branched-chain amino acid transport system ATP-binding protein
VNTYYGSSHILQGVELHLESEGDIFALIGRNGMGKTTLIRTIMGLSQASGGNIIFKGIELIGLQPWVIANLGLGYVPQGKQIFSTLTVRENLKIGERKDKGKWTCDLVLEFFPVLKERLNHLGKQLSGGEQQMLAIGRGLMTNPDLLLLDEPSEGLAPYLILNVGDVILKLSKENVAVFLVEQNLKMAQRISKKIYVIERGKIVYGESINDFNKDLERIKRDYLTA